MKPIITVIAMAILFITFGCNYDYGKYGKDKKESGSSQTNVDQAIPNEEAGSKD